MALFKPNWSRVLIFIAFIVIHIFGHGGHGGHGGKVEVIVASHTLSLLPPKSQN